MSAATRLVLAAIIFAVVAVSALTLATLAGCLRAPHSKKGGSHEAHRVTPGPFAASDGSRTTDSFGTDAERRMTPERSVTTGPIGFVDDGLGMVRRAAHRARREARAGNASAAQWRTADERAKRSLVKLSAPKAQLVERRFPKPDVAGSTPAGRAIAMEAT